MKIDIGINAAKRKEIASALAVDLVASSASAETFRPGSTRPKLSVAGVKGEHHVQEPEPD